MTIDTQRVVEQFVEFDPATLYEAAGREGMVDPSIRPAWPGARVCGVAFTVECPPADNLMLHHAVAAAKPGVVIVATLGGYLLKGAWGEILTVAAQVRGVVGLAVDGAVRDIKAIAERRFSTFSRGLAIGSCTKERVGTLGCPIQFGGVTVCSGDLIVGDEDGMVVIPRGRAEQVLEAARRRSQYEDKIKEGLIQGKTTIELLSLAPLPQSGATGK